MIRSSQGPLNVAQHGVHPPEMLCLTALRTAAGDNWLVFTADVLHDPEASHPVGVDHSSRLQMVLCPVLHSSCLLKPSTHLIRIATGCHSSIISTAAEKAFCLPPHAHTGLHAFLHSNTRHPAAQCHATAVVSAFPHGLHQLVLEHPSGVVVHSELTSAMAKRPFLAWVSR